MRGGYDTYFDGVVGPWLLDDFQTAIGVHRLDYVVLLPPADSLATRLRRRAGHSFTDVDVALEMRRQFDVASLDERHVVRTDAPLVDVASEVRRRRAAAELSHVGRGE